MNQIKTFEIKRGDAVTPKEIPVYDVTESHSISKKDTYTVVQIFEGNLELKNSEDVMVPGLYKPSDFNKI
ncbi:hypothetical protein COB55_00950 [Candidatus Wolfebacteria bacterium]|nr:MAG: hypothetical protein COB55_00950 [Candidatus Wolfebacteria bacterium]